MLELGMLPLIGGAFLAAWIAVTFGAPFRLVPRVILLLWLALAIVWDLAEGRVPAHPLRLVACALLALTVWVSASLGAGVARLIVVATLERDADQDPDH